MILSDYAEVGTTMEELNNQAEILSHTQPQPSND